ncbi:hypothetical protein MHB85_19090 [Paenibacillus sp. FSL K6-4396]|uniref:hypothetical protein n=1 Tax=Paenibacillus sp. FSL K6-4396 TaxID=2921506 RepID=UPI0030F96ABE
MDSTIATSKANLTVNTISTTVNSPNTYTIDKTQDKRSYWNRLVAAGAVGLSLAIGSVPTISEQTDLGVLITSPNEYGLGDIRKSSTLFYSESKLEAVEMSTPERSDKKNNVNVYNQKLSFIDNYEAESEIEQLIKLNEPIKSGKSKISFKNDIFKT